MPDRPPIRHTYTVLEDVRRERDRQEQLRRDGRFPYTCADPGIADHARLPILAEEFGEVAKALVERDIYKAQYYNDFPDRDITAEQRHYGGATPPERLLRYRDELRTELVQLAAVAVAWAEALTDV